MARTNFHGPKPVRAIEVLLYLTLIVFLKECFFKFDLEKKNQPMTKKNKRLMTKKNKRLPCRQRVQ